MRKDITTFAPMEKMLRTYPMITPVAANMATTQASHNMLADARAMGRRMNTTLVKHPMKNMYTICRT